MKCEFLHPGRSHKARVAKSLIDDAEQRGWISPERPKVLLERTGGNLGIALATEGSIRGYSVTLVTDPNYSRIKKDLAARAGATVLDRGVTHPECANNQEVIDILLKARDVDYHYLHQFENPANPRAHERGTGAEILAQLVGRGFGRDHTVVLVAGLGTGATMRGVSTTLETWFERVVKIAVQPAGCDLERGVYGTHGVQGIAVGEPAPFFDVSRLDAIVPVSDARIALASRRLLTDHRISVGPSSGANYAALELVRAGGAYPGPGFVFVSLLYDRGEDYE